MDKRRRGMICFGLGLGMLGVFTWFEAAPPAILEALPVAPLASATTPERSVRERLAGSSPSAGVRLRYSGRGEIEGLLGRRVVGWEVDVYRLPARPDGLVPHVVHIDKQQGASRGYPFDSIELGDSVTVCWTDPAGRIVRALNPPGAPPSEIDPAAFVIRMPEFTREGHVHVVEASDGCRWQMEPAGGDFAEAATVVVEVDSDSITQRIEQIDCHMRFCYDQESQIMLSLEISEHGHWRKRRGESNSRLELVDVSEIPLDRVETMAVDLESWEKFHRWILDVAHDISAPPSTERPQSPRSNSAAALVSTTALAPAVGSVPWRPQSSTAKTSTADLQRLSAEMFVEAQGGVTKEPYACLRELPDRVVEARDAMSDSVLRVGITSGMFALQASHSQLLGERKCVARLQRLDSLEWSSTDLMGVERSGTDYRGKPLVIGFLCRGTPHATRTIRAVAELRRRFTEDELAVVAFATTYSRENAEVISHAIGPSVPVFHDLELAERANLFSIGKSTLLLLDGAGKPRFIHTWQPIDLVERICSQVEEVRGTPLPTPETFETFEQDSSLKPAMPLEPGTTLQQVSLATP